MHEVLDIEYRPGSFADFAVVAAVEFGSMAVDLFPLELAWVQRCTRRWCEIWSEGG